MEGLDGDKEVESVMITATPPSKDVKSRKRKRMAEGWGSPSADAVSEKNMRETAPMFLARWKTASYKSSYEPRRLLEVEREMEVPTNSTTEQRLQASEDENETRFDERADMGSGRRQRMGLK